MRFIIKENKRLTQWVWQMVLQGDTSAITAPGQFVQVQLPGFYLRRPISICCWDSESLTLVYKVVGSGTEAMACMLPDTELDLLTGLGNGFDVSKCGEKPLLVGGGVGLPPLLGLAQALVKAGKKPQLLAGFGSDREIFLKDMADQMGVPFTVTTMDGSAGIKGLVTDALSALDFDSLCSCGPLPMMKAIDQVITVPAQYSFEERMGCGFGACMGCTIKVKDGWKRVCKDGPVLDREEVLW